MDHPFVDVFADAFDDAFGIAAAEAIARGIASRHGVTVQQLKARGRVKHVVAARRELFTALRRKGWSYPAIGEFVGGRDHTTVMWALGALPNKRQAQP